MEEHDLNPGDVIFFENNYQGDTPYDYVDHVAIYDGLDEAGQPTVIHCISNEQGYYYFQRSSGLCRSTLRSLTNLVQREEGYPDVPYHVTYKVFRCQNEAITHKALEVLRQQLQYRIPYDEFRLNQKLANEDAGMDADDFKDMAKEMYRSVGLFRSIKYAARHSMMLTRTRLDGIGRGLTCAMTIILGYQIAELLVDDKVRAQGHGEWASDKYASSTFLGHYPEAFVNYCQSLRAERYQPTGERHLKPSYHFWKDTSTSVTDYTHTTFAVDAKMIGAAGMFAYMSENDMWSYQGVLHAAERQYSQEERVRNRVAVLGASVSAIVQLRDASTQTSDLLSRRPSLDPVIVQEDADFPELDDCGGGDNWQNHTLRKGRWS